MNEKAYKTMTTAGAGSLTIGIITLVTGIAVGIIAIVNGVRLLRSRKGLTF